MAVHRASATPKEADADFRRMHGELIHYERDSGLFLYGSNPHPVMSVWAPRIYEFLQVLEYVISYAPARGLCREVGCRSGYDGALATVDAFGTPGDGLASLLAMPRVLAAAGWGLSEVAYDDATGDITWTFPKGTAVGVAAQRAGRRTNPACAFFEGFGAGWVKGSLGIGIEFHEQPCRSVSDGACRFTSHRLV